MFQSFDEAGSSAESASRTERLRLALGEAGVDGFLVPRADEFQGEYIPASADRLKWLTGFTGSAGSAVVLADEAAIFSDGRYTVQLAAQIDGAVFRPHNSVEISPTQYLREHAAGRRIGFDPWLHTIGEVAALEKAASEVGFTLVALKHNPVDRVWQDRPAPPMAAVRLHEERYAGRSAAEKLIELAAALAAREADACVLADPASMAWVLNIRGDDVPHKPLALGFSILRAEGPPLVFLDPAKLSEDVRASIGALAELHAPDEFETQLSRIAAGARVMLDPQLTARRIADIVEAAGGQVLQAADPASLPRARKNAVEIAGSRAAHRRDGAALTSFLAWLDRQVPGSITEIDAARKLEEMRIAFARRDGMELVDISFDTISAAGPHAALPHYRVNESSNTRLADGEVYLVDSGGQYFDATTDITRTVAIGDVAREVRQKFTLVLKGMIAVATARFPKGTRGVDLDPLARLAMWRAGCDFAHGTGHGIGSYLGVHEGPQSISRRGMTVLEEGMIVSDEPGYYREGAFGIRIENLLAVTPPEAIEGGDIDMHAFETLSFAPIDRRLILPELLSTEETAWLDGYHRKTRELLEPLLDEEDRVWLASATRPLGD